MARQLWVMVVAMCLAVGVMLIFAGRIADFVARHPTIKILALAFLILIGVMLVAEGLGQHISKGYIYFAMAFSVAVEMINLRVRAKRPPVETARRQDAAGVTWGQTGRSVRNANRADEQTGRSVPTTAGQPSSRFRGSHA